MKTYFRHYLIVEFELGAEVNAKFANGANKVRFSNLAITANINRASQLATMEMDIHGLSKDVMELLTNFKFAADVSNSMGVSMGNKQNKIRLYVPSLEKLDGIISGNPDSVVTDRILFNGTIISATADFNNAPDVAMRIKCSELFDDQSLTITPVTFGEDFYVRDIIDYIFKSAGKATPTYSTDAVNMVAISNHTVRGSFVEALQSVCLACNLTYTVNDRQYVIYRKGEPMPDFQAIPVNESTGLIGYPVMTEMGVDLRVLYTQDIRTADVIELKTTEQSFLNGKYMVMGVSLNLNSEIPSAEWVTNMKARYFERDVQNEKADGDYKPEHKEGEKLPDGQIYHPPISVVKRKNGGG